MREESKHWTLSHSSKLYKLFYVTKVSFLPDNIRNNFEAKNPLTPDSLHVLNSKIFRVSFTAKQQQQRFQGILDLEEHNG